LLSERAIFNQMSRRDPMARCEFPHRARGFPRECKKKLED
jgi:hypothetical protein